MSNVKIVSGPGPGSARIWVDCEEIKDVTDIRVRLAVHDVPRVVVETIASAVRIEGEMEVERVDLCPYCRQPKMGVERADVCPWQPVLDQAGPREGDKANGIRATSE